MLSRGVVLALVAVVVLLLLDASPAVAQGLRRQSRAVGAAAAGYARLVPPPALQPDPPQPPQLAQPRPGATLRVPLPVEEHRRIGRTLRLALTGAIELRAGAWWTAGGPRTYLDLGFHL
jgi:hypothetical protein